jgi:hypothetical protein
MISMLVETKVSIRRLQNYLSTDEMDVSYIEHTKDKKKKNAITITKGDFTWEERPNKEEELI